MVNRKKRLRSRIFVSFLLSITLLAQGALSPALPLALADTGTGTATTAPGVNPSMDVINQKLEAVAKEKGIPSVILKAVAFKESSWRQFDSQGNPLFAGSSAHPAIGIMQVASYDDKDQATIAKLMWALRRSTTIEEVKTIMHRNFSGEINPYGQRTAIYRDSSR